MNELNATCTWLATALLCAACGPGPAAPADARGGVDVRPGEVWSDRALAESVGLELLVPSPPAVPWYPAGSSDGDFYSAEYANMVVVGTDAAQRLVVLVAGRHSKYQPYFEKKEAWDDVLLVVGDDAFNAAGSELPGFEVAFDDAAGSVQIYLDLDMAGGDGSGVHVLADLHLDAVFHEARLFGLTPGGDGAEALGMSHRPAYLALAGDGGSVIGVGSETPSGLTSATGELELGHIDYAADPGMAFRYDYVCLVCPEEAWVYLHFQGHALSPEGPFGEMFEEMVSQSMAQEITLQGDRVEEGNPHGLPDDVFTAEAELIVSHVEDVGLGYMDRQLIHMEGAAGTHVWGLRELVTAKGTRD